jgi:ubiquinone/menaquinone biosynthesis C-methylase UbiE
MTHSRLLFTMMNNPIRAWSQRLLETPLLIGPRGALAGQRVLEIGCGRGVGVEILLGLGARHVVGLDLDPQMISLAQERLGSLADQTDVFVGDAQAIDAPDGSFDAVVGYGVIHHIPDWPAALKEVGRVLRSGGKYYFEEWLKGFTSSRAIRALFGQPQVAAFSGKEFRIGLGACGLRLSEWRQVGELGVVGCADK